jgi:hypothetical protein
LVNVFSFIIATISHGALSERIQSIDQTLTIPLRPQKDLEETKEAKSAAQRHQLTQTERHFPKDVCHFTQVNNDDEVIYQMKPEGYMIEDVEKYDMPYLIKIVSYLQGLKERLPQLEGNNKKKNGKTEAMANAVFHKALAGIGVN